MKYTIAIAAPDYDTCSKVRDHLQAHFAEEVTFGLTTTIPSNIMKTTNDALPFNHLGFIPKDRVAVFYRVETWKGCHFVADFALRSQAEQFAISDARAKGCRYDHKVSQMKMSTANR